MSNTERRYVDSQFEVRKEGDTATIAGYAAVFNRDSLPLGNVGFIEQVAPTAFTKTLKDKTDVRALVNHDRNFILGRTTNGTLRLAPDSAGLHYEVDGNLRKQSVRDIVEDIERGDMTQSSFGFSYVLAGTEWDLDSDPIRSTLREVELHDVSPVTFAAYPDSTAGLKRALRTLSQKTNKDLDRMVEAASRGELRAYVLDSPQVDDSAPATSHADNRPPNLRSRLADLKLGAAPPRRL